MKCIAAARSWSCLNFTVVLFSIPVSFITDKTAVAFRVQSDQFEKAEL